VTVILLRGAALLTNSVVSVTARLVVVVEVGEAETASESYVFA